MQKWLLTTFLESGVGAINEPPLPLQYWDAFLLRVLGVNRRFYLRQMVNGPESSLF
ncbi:hypothetical protein E2C01_054167 [Portunus trituberculatus]|uniref:Uncharacterized protein n=1 Tax=Portunus trituberculatus TaxID=210409 RepID=A0A5B7GIK0_PORTR|nr:hypothetical protein [Portunus trituberculatus]